MRLMPPGISGTLLPSHYVSDRLLAEAAAFDQSRHLAPLARWTAWWTRVASTCGPATGLRALFDLAAMPLFGALGFRASNAVFGPTAARVRLETSEGAAIAVLLLPWAARPSAAWRAAVEASAAVGARWCFILAPPFLSLLPTGASGLRRSVEFSFPDVLDPSGLSHFLALAHADAFNRRAGSAAPIDALVASAARFQDRVRSDLQHGVIAALEALMPAVRRSCEQSDPSTSSGSPRAWSKGKRSAKPDGSFEQTLTVLYRILFLLFAESRDLVPRHHPIYRDAYAIGTLCRQAHSADRARGLWDALAAVTRLSRTGCRVDDLIVRPFNGRLFARTAAPSLEARRPTGRPTRATVARDAAMQTALVALATRRTRAGREEISYADLGVEQLGAVYERVLDLPEASGTVPGFRGSAVPGLENRERRPRRPHSTRRKETGTFYTPQELTEFIVRRTLAPLVAGRPADDILALRVVDPAMGSGAFLVAACRYLAAAYEHALVEEGRCSDEDLGPAERARIRRLVAERCLAGVDVNPVAVQLARLSLWLATMSEGKPLSFFDHRLRAGDSLIGAWPDDLRRVSDRARGAPVSSLPLLDDLDLAHSMCQTTRPLLAMIQRSDETVDDVRAKEATWTRLAGDRSPLAPWRRAASLWCARWFWPAEAGPAPSPAELRAALDAILKGDSTLRTGQLSRLVATAAALETERRFFHWPLEFPDVFYDEAGSPKNRPGFDAVIGNPPWEMLRDDPASPSAAAKAPAWLATAVAPARPAVRAVLRFVRDSGLYPSCDRGHMNLYQPFVERALSIARPGGRVGLVLPWGLAVDDGATSLRERLLATTSINAVVGLDNANGLFPIHRGVRFLALMASTNGCTTEIRARFGVRTREELAALDTEATGAGSRETYPIRLSRPLISKVGGAAQRIPDFRRLEDLDLLERVASRSPRLGSREGWGAQFGRELNATDDRSRFGDRGLPVLEGKHVQPFRASTTSCAFRILKTAAVERLPDTRFMRPRLAYRDVAGVSNRLSLISAVIPEGVVTTHTLFCLRTPLPLERQHFLCGLFNSYVLNAIVRMLMGNHLTTSLVEDLPVPVWAGSALQLRIARLARRLSRAAGTMGAHARLQASVALLYGLEPDCFADILAGFPLVPKAERDAALRCLSHESAP